MSRILLHIDATAGWGKTTAIEQDIKRYAHLTAGWKPDKALYIVFTRRNAKSVRRRLEGYVKKENIRTLHSFCYSYLKEKRPVMDGKLLEKFTRKYAYEKLSSGAFFIPKTKHDILLSLYYYSRNTLTPFDRVLKEREKELHKLGIGHLSAYEFFYRWENFKKEESAVDYADILEISKPIFEGIYLALDEAQDNTLLMWKAIEKIIRRAPFLKRVIVVGDCDQTVYSFQGSSSEHFLTLPSCFAKKYGFTYEKPHTEHISRRVPSNPLSFALKFLTKVKNRDTTKRILPAREGGKVIFASRKEFLKKIPEYISNNLSVIIQERHRHELIWWKRYLDRLNIPYTPGYDEHYRQFRAFLMLEKNTSRDYLNFYTVFKDVIPVSYIEYLVSYEKYLEDYRRNKKEWINRVNDRRLRAFLLNPKGFVVLTTMHSQKGEEGDVVWVSGRWTRRIRVSDEERKLYFTACTRTKNILVIDRDGWNNIVKLL